MALSHRAAMRALVQMEQDAIARARAEGERARGEAEAARRRDAPVVLSIPINGWSGPPTPGELAAMQAGAKVLAGLRDLEARRWPLSMPVFGGGR